MDLIWVYGISWLQEALGARRLYIIYIINARRLYINAFDTNNTIPLWAYFFIYSLPRIAVKAYLMSGGQVVVMSAFNNIIVGRPLHKVQLHLKILPPFSANVQLQFGRGLTSYDTDVVGPKMLSWRTSLSMSWSLSSFEFRFLWAAFSCNYALKIATGETSQAITSSTSLTFITR